MSTSSPAHEQNDPTPNRSGSPSASFARFVLVALLVFAAMGGIAFGLISWVLSTNTTNYPGREKIIRPENPPVNLPIR